MLSVEFDALLEMVTFPWAAAAESGSKPTEIVTDPFGVSVKLVPPLALNPPPLAETPDIVTFAVPESVSTTDCVLSVLTVTLPNPTPFVFAVSVDSGCVAGLLGATAVADIGICTTEFVALLETESVPCTAPVLLGLNVTETESVLLGFTLVADALALNPVPVAVTADMATLAVPESVSVTVFVAGVPTVTLPNARLVVGVVSFDDGGATPVPESVMFSGLFVALLEIDNVP
jgi:hypothetical protein